MSQSFSLVIIYYTFSILLAIVFGVLRLVKRLSCLHAYIHRFLCAVASVQLPIDMWDWETLFGWNMFKSMQRTLLLELSRKAHKNGTAPNSVVFSLDGSSKANLLDYGREHRPLVLVFGSLTCPVFRQKLKEYSQLIRDLEDVADFVLVYIEEAHPYDGWRFKNNYKINQHKSLDERCAAAKCFVDSMAFKGRIVVDSMENECNLSYAAVPIRLCIILDGQIQHIGGVGPTFYELNEVREWIHNWLARYPNKGFEENDNSSDLQLGRCTITNKGEKMFTKRRCDANNNYKRNNKIDDTKSLRLCTSHHEMVKIQRQP